MADMGEFFVVMAYLITHILCELFTHRFYDSNITPNRGRFVIKRRNKLISPIKSLRNIRQNTKEKSSGKSKPHKGGSPVGGSSEDSLTPHEGIEGIISFNCPMQEQLCIYIIHVCTSFVNC